MIVKCDYCFQECDLDENEEELHCPLCGELINSFEEGDYLND